MNSIRTNSLAGSQPAPWKSAARTGPSCFLHRCRVSADGNFPGYGLSFHPSLPANRRTRGLHNDACQEGELHAKLAELSARHGVTIIHDHYPLPAPYQGRNENPADRAGQFQWMYRNDLAAFIAGLDVVA